MLKIKLKNEKEYDVLPNTVIYPSYNSTARSRFEIHMSADAMTVEELEVLLNESDAAEIHLINTDNGSDVTYFDYVILSSVGKKLISYSNPSTNEVTHTLELVAELEQLTYIEKQLKALNVQF